MRHCGGLSSIQTKKMPTKLIFQWELLEKLLYIFFFIYAELNRLWLGQSYFPSIRWTVTWQVQWVETLVCLRCRLQYFMFIQHYLICIFQYLVWLLPCLMFAVFRVHCNEQWLLFVGQSYTVVRQTEEMCRAASLIRKAGRGRRQERGKEWKTEERKIAFILLFTESACAQFSLVAISVGLSVSIACNCWYRLNGLCLTAELTGEGSVAVAVGISDRLQVTCNMWHMTCDTWHMTWFQDQLGPIWITVQNSHKLSDGDPMLSYWLMFDNTIIIKHFGPFKHPLQDIVIHSMFW